MAEHVLGALVRILSHNHSHSGGTWQTEKEKNYIALIFANQFTFDTHMLQSCTLLIFANIFTFVHFKNNLKGKV